VSQRNPVVLVTGASSGIGYATALAFAERGARVVGVARREERLRELMERCRAHAPESFHLVGDLGERAVAEGVVDETLARCGRLDVLVNNAGVTKHKHVYHTSADEVERVMRVNFMSCVWTTFAAIPAMLRQGSGTIVNVSSFASKVVPPREPVYAASKAAMDAFTEGLWSELEGSGIHAGLVVVGPIDTEIWDKLEEPPAFRGRKYPPRVVTDAIFEVVAKRRYEVTAPRRNPQLALARLLRLLAPGLVRRGVRRMDPVPPELVEAARRRAEQGLRLGQGAARE